MANFIIVNKRLPGNVFEEVYVNVEQIKYFEDNGINFDDDYLRVRENAKEIEQKIKEVGGWH